MSQIAQYIEDYLDLIENSPNEIIRKITQLHEKNHLYSKLSEKLEEMLKILLDNGGTIGEIKVAVETNERKSEDRLQAADKQPSARSDSAKADGAKTDSAKVDSEKSDCEKPDCDKPDSEKSEEGKLNETTNEKKPEDRNRPEEGQEKRPEELDENKQPDKMPDKVKQLSAEEEAERIASRKQRALGSVSRLLLEIQEIEDEKLAIVQSVLEHLDFKNKQLEQDFRNLSSQSTNSKSNSNSSSQNTNDEDSLSGNQENSNNELNHQKETAVCSASAQLSQLSSVNNHHHSSSNSKRASSRRNLTTGKQEFSSNDLNSSHNGNNNNSNNGNSSSNHKRGVKRGSGVSGKSSNREIKRNRSNSQRDLENSPTNPFDEAPIDPDEPTYCVCEQVSFGEMICCDNLDCPIEWFHFGCVGLTSKPRGKWYCPNCRGDRSNIPKK